MAFHTGRSLGDVIVSRWSRPHVTFHGCIIFRSPRSFRVYFSLNPRSIPQRVKLLHFSRLVLVVVSPAPRWSDDWVVVQPPFASWGLPSGGSSPLTSLSIGTAGVRMRWSLWAHVSSRGPFPAPQCRRSSLVHLSECRVVTWSVFATFRACGNNNELSFRRPTCLIHRPRL